MKSLSALQPLALNLGAMSKDKMQAFSQGAASEAIIGPSQGRMKQHAGLGAASEDETRALSEGATSEDKMQALNQRAIFGDNARLSKVACLKLNACP